MTKTRVNFAGGGKRSGKAQTTRGKVTYGAVTVVSASQQTDVVSRNVKAGQSALKRAAGRIIMPGISLRTRRSVPLYYADDNHPGSIVRELDGVKVLGSFLNGKFVASNG